MADNYANPLKGAETDMNKATKAITGLLNPMKNETCQKFCNFCNVSMYNFWLTFR